MLCVPQNPFQNLFRLFCNFLVHESKPKHPFSKKIIAGQNLQLDHRYSTLIGV